MTVRLDPLASDAGVPLHLLPPSRRRGQEIIRFVCERTGLTPANMRHECRRRNFARPRQVAMALVRRHCGYSLPQIGLMFCRDHTTVLSSIRKVAELRETDEDVRWLLDEADRHFGSEARP